MQLDLIVYRDQETNNSVMGQLWVHGLHWLYTLEPARKNPCWPGHPCIPAGRYPVRLTMSPHLSYVCPELLDVPGRSEIRIHVGNWPKDFQGCTGVGENRGYDYIEHSKGAFKRLMSVLKSYDPIWITYVDGPPPAVEEASADGETTEPSTAVAPASATDSLP